jgi:hypothetical protein
MTKLAIIAVLASTLATACIAPEPYHYGYSHHHYWARRAYWRHGYWLNGAWVNSNIYIDPNVALPTGVTVPEVQVDAYGNYTGPGVVAPPTTVSGTATSPMQVPVNPDVSPPGMTQPIAPNTASGVAQ